MPRSRAPMSTLAIGCGTGVSATASGVTAARRVNSGRMSSAESRPWSYRVAAAEAMLVGAEEPQRLNQMQMLLGTGHGDIQQAALFVDLRWLVGGHIRGDAAINEVQHVNSVPFLPLGRMDCRQDQIILVELKTAGVGAARIGRVECHLGEEAFAARVTHGNLFELVEVCGA